MECEKSTKCIICAHYMAKAGGPKYVVEDLVYGTPIDVNNIICLRGDNHNDMGKLQEESEKT